MSSATAMQQYEQNIIVSTENIWKGFNFCLTLPSATVNIYMTVNDRWRSSGGNINTWQTKATYFSPRFWFKWLTGLICWRKKDIGGIIYICFENNPSCLYYMSSGYRIRHKSGDINVPSEVWWLLPEEILVDSVLPYLYWKYDLLSACIPLES